MMKLLTLMLSGLLGLGVRGATAQRKADGTYAPQLRTAQVGNAPAGKPISSEATQGIILISTGVGNGTGFICSMNNTNYIVTNAHVLQGARRFEFQQMNGGRLHPLRLEVAYDRDVARLMITNNVSKPFALAERDPQFNEPVYVFGDSQGMGTITRLNGLVQGMGAENLEVSAPFVSGNSGSPILSADDKVLGVATYVVKIKPNWINQGTRFAEPRRFGMRLNDVRWVQVAVRQFIQESALLMDCETYIGDCAEMFEILQRGNIPVVKTARESSSYADDVFRQTLANFCTNIQRAIEGLNKGRDERSPAVTSHLNMARALIQQLPDVPASKLRQTRWSTKYHQQIAAEYLELFDAWKKENQGADLFK